MPDQSASVTFGIGRQWTLQITSGSRTSTPDAKSQFYKDVIASERRSTSLLHNLEIETADAHEEPDECSVSVEEQVINS